MLTLVFYHWFFMHIHNLEEWQHPHDFSTTPHQAEKNTTLVLGLTALTMVVEIVAGTLFRSMALLADGLHMATHVAAFAITVFAYQYARSHARNPKYTFGTGKVSVLGGFTSAVALTVIAFVMALESLIRFFEPQAIQFNEAIYVAFVGLVVNLASAFLLQHHPDHAHAHDHFQAHGAHHHPEHLQEHQPQEQEHLQMHRSSDHGDHNLRAAYLHVIADAVTSVFAIVALFAGKFWGWVWLDALVGVIGAALITQWAASLVRETSTILLDGAADQQTKRAIVQLLEENSDRRVTDLHVWYISQHHLAASISLVTHFPQSPDHYKTLLRSLPTLVHLTIEVNPCDSEPCARLSRDENHHGEISSPSLQATAQLS